MDPRLNPDDALTLAQGRLDSYRREAAEAALVRSYSRRSRRGLRLALGNALIGMGHALAGEPAR